VLSGNSLMQYSSDDETQPPQSSLFLKNHTVKELMMPDTHSDDVQKFMFEISPSVGEHQYTYVNLSDSDSYWVGYFSEFCILYFVYCSFDIQTAVPYTVKFQFRIKRLKSQSSFCLVTCEPNIQSVVKLYCVTISFPTSPLVP